MNIKKIISTTLMFFVIVGVVVVFKSVFGEINTLVGVSGITAALSLLGTDYTINPIKSTLYFILIEVLLGICSFLSSTNAFLGLIITFIVIFFILYEFTYNTKKPTYVAFTLSYFFMLYTPVSINQLDTRLYSLAFVGLSIMALQLIVNRNRIQKQSKVTIKESVEVINKQINLILDNSSADKYQLNTQAHNILMRFTIDIYNRLEKDVDLPASLIQVFYICQFLENINLLLAEIKSNTLNNEYINHLENIKLILIDLDNFNNGDLELEGLIDKLNKFLGINNDYSSKYYLIYKLDYFVSLLKEDLLQSKENSFKKMYSEYSIVNIVNGLTSFKNNISKDSLKFTFAFRGALVTSLGVFVVAFFNIPHGKWLVFSLISVVQPYLESSKVKGKDRIIGTILGLLIFEFLFTIITDTTARTLLILLTGYISNYQTEYKYQMICTTISSLGSASLGVNINELTLERLSLVLLGTIIALYANKIILPYSMIDVTKQEIKSVIELNKKIIRSLYDIALAKSKINNEVKEAIAKVSIINKKIDFNNNTLLSEDVNDFLYNQRVFANKLQFLINNYVSYYYNHSHEFTLFYNIEMVVYRDIPSEEIIQILNNTENIYARLILINALELKNSVENSVLISKDVYTNL